MEEFDKELAQYGIFVINGTKNINLTEKEIIVENSNIKRINFNILQEKGIKKLDVINSEILEIHFARENNINICFDDCLFLEQIDAQKLLFKNKLDFIKCIFNKAINFSDSIFNTMCIEKHVSFKKCTFNFNVFFNKTRFETHINFEESTFEKQVIFNEAFFKPRNRNKLYRNKFFRCYF